MRILHPALSVYQYMHRVQRNQPLPSDLARLFNRPHEEHIVRRLEQQLARRRLARGHANHGGRAALVQRLGRHVDLAARHRFEEIDARGIAHVVHAKRIRREPAADFSNEIARAAMDTAAIIAQAFGNVHREVHIPRLAYLDNLNILSELGRFRNVAPHLLDQLLINHSDSPSARKMLFVPTTPAAFIGVIFVQPSHCINKQLPLSVETNRERAAPLSST